MDVQEMLEIFDREQRRDVTWSDTRREVTPEVVRSIDLNNPNAVVIYSNLTAENADAIIERELVYAAQSGWQLMWKLYSHDQPADLGARLAAHGLEPEELEAVLILDLNAAPPQLMRPVALPDDTFVMARLARPEQINDVIAVEDDVWGRDNNWLQNLADELKPASQELSVYCVYAGSRPVSTAWVRFHCGTQFASLWGGSTLEGYRRQGLYTALLAVRAQEARARGFRFLTIDASPMSRPICEKHGFQLISFAQDHKQPARWAEPLSPSQAPADPNQQKP